MPTQTPVVVWDPSGPIAGANATSLYVSFTTGSVSDFSGLGTGWSATAWLLPFASSTDAKAFAAVDTPPQSACPGPLSLTGAGTFSLGAYNNHLSCTWTLNADPPTARVALVLSGVSLQPTGTAGNCLDAVDVWLGVVG